MNREIGLNHKFAFIAVSTRVKRPFRVQLETTALWATTDLPAQLDAEWQGWIGSLRAARLGRDCNLFLCASLESSQPHILDGENQQLARDVALLFGGLTLTGTIEFAHVPVMLGGAREDDRLVIRTISDLARPIMPAGVKFDVIDENMLREAYDHRSGRLSFAKITAYDRIARVLGIYDKAMAETSVHERLHQFCRCVEGMILPDVGKTRRQFMSRCALFVGPRHADLLGQLYDMRSRVEHMHEYKFPAEMLERDRRIEVMRKAALAQALARHCIGHFLTTPALHPHYATAHALAAFWRMDAADRAAIWGPPIDLEHLDAKFAPERLNNIDLGL